MRGFFQVAVTQGSKWQDEGARERERKRDHLGWYVRRCSGCTGGSDETDTEEEEGSQPGKQKSREGRVKVEKES